MPCKNKNVIRTSCAASFTSRSESLTKPLSDCLTETPSGYESLHEVSRSRKGGLVRAAPACETHRARPRAVKGHSETRSSTCPRNWSSGLSRPSETCRESPPMVQRDALGQNPSNPRLDTLRISPMAVPSATLVHQSLRVACPTGVPSNGETTKAHLPTELALCFLSSMMHHPRHEARVGSTTSECTFFHVSLRRPCG